LEQQANLYLAIVNRITSSVDGSTSTFRTDTLEEEVGILKNLETVFKASDNITTGDITKEEADELISNIPMANPTAN
jgi:hypothetical protein